MAYLIHGINHAFSVDYAKQAMGGRGCFRDVHKLRDKRGDCLRGQNDGKNDSVKMISASSGSFLGVENARHNLTSLGNFTAGISTNALPKSKTISRVDGEELKHVHDAPVQALSSSLIEGSTQHGLELGCQRWMCPEGMNRAYAKAVKP